MLCENQDLKFIIFAYHRVMLDSICEQLVDDNVTFIRIDGSTVTSDRPVFIGYTIFVYPYDLLTFSAVFMSLKCLIYVQLAAEIP